MSLFLRLVKTQQRLVHMFWFLMLPRWFVQLFMCYVDPVQNGANSVGGAPGHVDVNLWQKWQRTLPRLSYPISSCPCKDQLPTSMIQDRCNSLWPGFWAIGLCYPRMKVVEKAIAITRQLIALGWYVFAQDNCWSKVSQYVCSSRPSNERHQALSVSPKFNSSNGLSTHINDSRASKASCQSFLWFDILKKMALLLDLQHAANNSPDYAKIGRHFELGISVFLI